VASPSVVIAGAGIGGLTAALALAARGCDVTLIERRTGFSEIGAGIQLSPNASRVLFGLGLGPALRHVATEPDRLAVRALASGRGIGAMALGRAMQRRFGAPYLVVHRANLQTVLLDAVRARPNLRLLVGRSAVAAETIADRARVTIESASAGEEHLEADVAIGADGVWSRLRAALGDRREPVYRGFTAWRATIAREVVPAALAGNEIGLWLGSDGHVVHYPIAGGTRLNIVAFERRREALEGWAVPGAAHDLRAVFGGAAPPLRDLLAAPREWTLWSLFDLPAGAMARGRIALLGDAAHPVLPFLAQGGALAIEDAAAAAAALAACPSDPAAALQAYEAARLRRVRRVQRSARRNGAVYHARGPLALARNLVMRRLGPDGMVERYRWLYGWTPPG